MHQTTQTTATPREQEIQRFKQRFSDDLDAFIGTKKLEAKQAGEDESKWSATDIQLKIGSVNPLRPYVLLIDNNGKNHLRLHELPQDLTSAEQYQLRRFIAEECAERGIKKLKVRAKPLEAEITNGVRERDPEALDIWIKKHAPRWLKQAKSLMRQTGTGRTAEPEDVVQKALLAFLKSENSDSHPLNIFGCNLMWSTSDPASSGEISLTSDMADDQSWREYLQQSRDLEDIATSKILELLQASQRRLTGARKNILGAFLDQHEKNKDSVGYYALSATEIAQRIKPEDQENPLSRDRIYQLLTGRTGHEGSTVTDRILNTARELGHSDPEMQAVVEYIQHMLQHYRPTRGGRYI